MNEPSLYENITPYIFITKHLITSLKPDAEILVCIKNKNPKNKDPWTPTVLTENTLLPPSSNLYISISSCTKLNDENSPHHGQYRNKLSCAAQTHMFMLDDLGDETTPNKPDHNNLPITPTWTIETSPHNYQCLYVLTEPLDDISLANKITKQLPGQTRSDKSSVNAVRWARLPGGINNKPEYLDESGTPFNVRIKQAHPECTYHTSEIIDAFTLELAQKPIEQPIYEEVGIAPEGWERHISAMCAIDPACPYDIWFNVACVMHPWGEQGRAAFIEWSKASTKHNLSEQEISAKFDSVDYDITHPKGHKSIVSWPWLEARAKEYGWTYETYSTEVTDALIKQTKVTKKANDVKEIIFTINDYYLTAIDLERIIKKTHRKLKSFGDDLTLTQVRYLATRPKKIKVDDDYWTYHLTDEGNFDRFHDLYRDIYFYIPEKNKHIEWSEKEARWLVDNTSQGVAINTIDHITRMETKPLNNDQRKALNKWRHTCSAFSRITSLTTLIRRDMKIRKSVHQLDASPTLLGLPKQVLNMENNVISDNTPHHLITMQTKTTYNTDATCPRWNEFILQIMNDNQEMAEFMQKIAGYALFGGNPEQIFIVLNGTGANGKSTFTSTLEYVLGDYSTLTHVDTIARPKFNKSGGGASPDLVSLFRKRLVICNEWDENTYINESLIKILSGGTDAISVRALYANEYISYIPEFLLMLATNHTPKIASMDYAIWRRLLIIPFDVNFDAPELRTLRDPHLMTYFRENETEGILNWMIKGYRMWRDKSIIDSIPELLISTREAYKHEMDTIGQFITERCLTGDELFRTKSSDLYQAYNQWSKEQGNIPKAARTFSRGIIERGHKRVRMGSVNGYNDIRLLTLSEIAEADQHEITNDDSSTLQKAMVN